MLYPLCNQPVVRTSVILGLYLVSVLIMSKPNSYQIHIMCCDLIIIIITTQSFINPCNNSNTIDTIIRHRRLSTTSVPVASSQVHAQSQVNCVVSWHYAWTNLKRWVLGDALPPHCTTYPILYNLRVTTPL